MLVYSHEINVKFFLFKYTKERDNYIIEKLKNIRNQMIVLIAFAQVFFLSES